MHPALNQIIQGLSEFGLNPAQWLIQKISLQQGGTFVVFQSKNKDLCLKGQLSRRHKEKSFVIQSLEFAGF